MSDEHLDELLGAYAIDAVDDDERQRVEAYLAANPRALDEVRAHQNTAALLGETSAPPPPGVWDRIAASIEGAQPEPGPELAKVLPLPQRSRWRSWGTLAAAAAVAAVAAAAVFVVVRDDDGGETAIEDVYDEAVADPDAIQVRLESPDGAVAAVDAVVTPGGRGFIAAGNLPELDPTETYQLWGFYGTEEPISLGVLGNEPGIEPFSAGGELTTLAVSRERAGGVVAPTEVVLLGELA